MYNHERFPSRVDRFQEMLKAIQKGQQEPATDPPVAELAVKKLPIELTIAAIRTICGEDEVPSELWEKLQDIPGSDPDGWELAQDINLMLADIGQAALDNLDNPPMIPVAITGVIAQWFPELQADGEALQD